MNVEETGYHEWLIDGKNVECTVEDYTGYLQLSLSLAGQVAVTPSNKRFISVDFGLDEEDATELVEVMIEGIRHARWGCPEVLKVLESAVDKIKSEGTK